MAAILCILLVPSIASAQTFFGLEGGVNFNTIDFHVDDIPDEFLPEFKTKPGAVGGVFVGHDLGGRLGLQVEALFARKVIESEDVDIEGQPISAKLRLNYLEVPVFIQARIGASEEASFRVYAGPSVAFKLSERVESSGVDSDDDAGLKSYDAGIGVGAAVTIQRFVVDGRYTHGLVNIEDEDSDGGPVHGVPSGVSAKNRTFAILVGWRFR